MNKNVKHNVDFITQKVGKKSGFSIPTNYFDGIETTMLTSVSEKNLPKRTSFSMPKGYFENIEDKILDQVANKEETKEVIVVPLQVKFRQFISYTSVAAVLIIMSVYFLYNLNTTVTFNDITASEIEEWYDKGYGNTDNIELAMVLEKVDLTEDASSNLTFSDENIEEYFKTINTDVLFDEIQ